MVPWRFEIFTADLKSTFMELLFVKVAQRLQPSELSDERSPEQRPWERDCPLPGHNSRRSFRTVFVRQ